MPDKMKYVLLALLFLFPIPALTQESVLAGGSEEAMKDSSAVGKESTADPDKKNDGGEQGIGRGAEAGIIVASTVFISGVILLIIYIRKRREKERTLILNALAMEIGLDFLPAQDDELLAKMQVFYQIK